MELRQIVRDQKLINFDLSSLISEAPPTPAQQAATKGLTHAGSGYYIDNTGKTVAQTVKGKLVPVSDDEDTKTSGDKGGEERDPQVTQDPEDKDIEDIGDEWADDGVDIEDEARDNINQEMDSLELNPHSEDENSFVDENGNEIFQIGPDGKIGPGGDIGDFKSPEGIPYAEYIDDLNDRLYGDEPQKPDEEKVDEPTDTDGRRIIAGRDKTLKDVDSTETEEFQRELEPSDEEFAKRNKKFANPIPPPAFTMPKGLLDDPNFPRKYVKALERIINTRPEGDAKRWGHYSDVPGGQGRIQAQAGELMTMMGASMSDEDFATFTDAISNHVETLVDDNPDMKKDSTRSVSKSWIKAAQENRTAILNRIRKDFPGAEIVATSWDTPGDVEALGLDGYDENKGFSTDMYMKIRTADGDILDEISLKKDTNVNFLNSGTGNFIKWDPDLPDNINPNVYTDIQRKNLAKAGVNFKNDIVKLLNKKPSASDSPELKNLRKLMKSKKIDFETALQATAGDKGSRDKSNIVQAGINALAATGNGRAEKFMENVDRQHREYNAEAIKAIITNKKLKEGMLEEIRSEFPLKAVGEGEETMAIGDLSLDKSTMTEIFGTDDFEEIKQKLSAEPGPPPYLSYRAGPKDDIIPLAEIVVREDGVGYGGQFKFEMTLDKRFAEKLREANEAVYGSTNESIKFLGNILSETKQNTLSHHWAKAEENYSVDQFIREINEGSLN